MVKKFIPFLILTFFTTSMFCQIGNAVYIKQLKSIIPNESDIADDEDRLVKKILENLKTYEYQLIFNEQKATYKKVKKLNSDTSSVLKAMTEGVANFRGTIFFDSSSKIVLHQQEFAGVDYLIENNKLDWILTKDTLQIDNYLCYKAKTTVIIKNADGKNELEALAWYSPEITIPYGPDGYSGLPGLILQLDFNGIITSLKKIEFFEDANKVDDFSPSINVQKVFEDEFNNIVAKHLANRKNKY